MWPPVSSATPCGPEGRQLQCVGVRVSDLVRAALIYEQLRHLMGGDANANFRKLEQAYFRTDYRLFVRAALTLLGAATQAGGPAIPPDESTSVLVMFATSTRQMWVLTICSSSSTFLAARSRISPGLVKSYFVCLTGR